MARNIGKTKSRTNSSRRSSMKMFSGLMPSFSAFSLAGASSSPWPRSAVKVTTSALYSVCSHFRMIDVSSPPE
ncbi:hypothetical protein D9M69_574730 [compost metagenome]